MQTKRQIQELLMAAGVSPNRRLGQHFLVDLNLMRLLVDSAGIGPGDAVLEVGMGTGSLTEALAPQAGEVVAVELDPALAGIAQDRLAGAGNVRIVRGDVLCGKGTIHPAVTEAVSRARARLADRGSQRACEETVQRGMGLGSPTRNHELGVGSPPRSFAAGVPVARQPMNHRQDADATRPHGQDGDPKRDSSRFGTRAPAGSDTPSPKPLGPAGQSPATPRLLLVSNLPYDVASSVMINLVKGPVTADTMSVTVQKEVADRMTASPGSRDYGTLSIFLQATGEVELIRLLKPGVFWPPPGVDSAIVRYRRDEARSRRILDMDFFGSVVALFIGHRRKMLRACVKQARPELGGRAFPGHPARASRAGRLGHDSGGDLWSKVFELNGIEPTRRPEELSPGQYVDLANTCRRLLHTARQ